MANQFVTFRINTDRDLSDSSQWQEVERLLLGYPSSIDHDEILEAEVVEHKSKEGWLTTA